MRIVLMVLLALVLGGEAAHAEERRVQGGRLSCEVEGGFGLILGSSKDMTCAFRRRGHRTEYYEGTINKLGLDLGVTERTHIEWLVFAAAESDVRRRALAGDYVGGSAEATIGVGLGANWLIGGSRRSFALQPVSVQAQTGLNVSLAFSGLHLR